MPHIGRLVRAPSADGIIATVAFDIAEVLARVAPSGSFTVQRTAPAESLRIEVEGVGRLSLPLSARDVSRLRVVARPSKYGWKHLTLYDPGVRSSWEISRRRIRIDAHRWNATLLPLLEKIRAGLGLADGIELKAELHNMLIYEKGQSSARIRIRRRRTR